MDTKALIKVAYSQSPQLWLNEHRKLVAVAGAAAGLLATALIGWKRSRQT